MKKILIVVLVLMPTLCVAVGMWVDTVAVISPDPRDPKYDSCIILISKYDTVLVQQIGSDVDTVDNDPAIFNVKNFSPSQVVQFVKDFLNTDVELLRVDYGDSAWTNPKYTELLDRIYNLNQGYVIPCCTVLVVDTVYLSSDSLENMKWKWFDSLINESWKTYYEAVENRKKK